MGMFDTINCKIVLPMPDNPRGYTGSYSFQTKDFDCALDNYIIDENSNLLIVKTELKHVEGDPNDKSFFGRFGRMEKVKEWTEPTNITKCIEMYDYIQSNDTDYDYAISYNVYLSSGHVERITLNKFEAYDNVQRKKDDAEFIERLKKLKKFHDSFLYKYFYTHINSVTRILFSLVYKFGLALSKNAYKLTEKLRI
jgi:hypothetical protein